MADWMDWAAAIERNRTALKRVLAELVAMAGLGSGGQFTLFPPKNAPLQDVALAEKSKLSPALTIPRRLHSAILRLLRPAESAARRLVIVAARDIVVTLPPPRPSKPQPPKRHSAFLRNRTGTGIILPRGVRTPGARPKSRTLSLPMFDPLRISRRPRRVASTLGVPRISVPGFTRPAPIRPPPSPYDLIDAARLVLRFQALTRALDDLPALARRYARWQARRKAAAQNSRLGRIGPLRGGRPPGSRQKPKHKVDDILKEAHGLAFWSMESPDTS